MEGLLTPVSTTYKTKEDRKDAFFEIAKISKPVKKSSFEPATPLEALEILKHEPDHDSLVSTLRFLTKGTSDFNIASPNSITSQLVYVLVTEVLPNYWYVLSAEDITSTTKHKRSQRSSELELLLECLRSVAGLNAILLALKRNIQLSKVAKKADTHNVREIILILLQASMAVLEGSGTVENIWSSICKFSDTPAQKKALWNEVLGNIGGGKLLGIAAEAEYIINDLSQKVGTKYWVADNTLFSTWLTQNVRHWAKNIQVDAQSDWKCCGELFGKLLRLGRTETVVADLLDTMVLQSQDKGVRFVTLLNSLPASEQRNVLYSALHAISKQHYSASVTSEADSSWWKSDAKVVSGAASLVKLLVAGSDSRNTQLLAWLTSSSGAGVGEGVGIRRSVIAVLGDDKSRIETLLEKSIQQFGDQLYIRHTPTIQQEVHAQVLLLSAGCVHRKSPLRLTMMMRSGAHLNTVSNRLASSSPRAQFLGMVVGEALSSLVDKGDNKMDFKVEEMSTTEANWFKSLVYVADTIGSVDLLKTKVVSKPTKRVTSQPAKKSQPFDGTSKIISIEEVDDHDEDKSEESDDDGLVPYGKPDSDAEDSDEDATNIVRNKPTVPVYIRDLITYLRDTDNYDRQNIGLSTAASLIRRKASFGTEVSTHAEELATLLVGIQDKYEIDDFQELRLQGMIAILISSPKNMGQWFAKTLFDGDYSLSQRASVLTTLGLGAREIGGFGKEDTALTKNENIPSNSFPSKELPPAMHALYISDSTSTKPKQRALPFSAISTLSSSLQKSLTRPIAASALASSNGPQIMNVIPVSTRQITSQRTRPKPITNALSSLVSTSFFFPLTGRFFIHLRAYGSSSSKNITFDPFLLSLFVKTLALILDAAGPNTVSLPQMTSEFWDLLLGLRTQSTSEISVLESVLFAFLVLLEINSDKRGLVETHGRQLLETQEWVEGVFSRLGSSTRVHIASHNDAGAEEDKVRVLAASVLVRIRECVEKYQTLLMGDLASFS